ncbi:hypothetical protein QR98_0103730, partial [Sarcoptes scabiei]
MLWWVSSLNNRGRVESGIVADQDECSGVADGGSATGRGVASGLVDAVDQDAAATGVGSGEYSGLRVVGDAEAGTDSAGGDGDESDDGVGVASADSWEAVLGALHNPGEAAAASGR